MDTRSVRTLADYRPQHDNDCASGVTDEMGYFPHTDDNGNPNVPCTCGLDALLVSGTPGEEQVTKEKTDGASLLRVDQPASPTTNEALPQFRRVWLMECLYCHRFGTPVSSSEMRCGNCGSIEDTRMWFRDLRVLGSGNHSSEQHSEERAGAQRHTNTSTGEPQPPQVTGSVEQTFAADQLIDRVAASMPEYNRAWDRVPTFRERQLGRKLILAVQQSSSSPQKENT